MQFDILTLFPELINSYGAESILGRGQKAGVIKIEAHNFRDFTLDKQKHVDDRPYGGGAGMVLQVEPIYRCLESLGVLSGRLSSRRSTVIPASTLSSRRKPGSYPVIQTKDSGFRRNDNENRSDRKTKIIIMDPAGKKFDQKMAEKFSRLDRLVIVAGRYEGFDERIYKFVDEKISVGDYVLAGGELPALTIIEATSRLIPGVLGNQESLKEETVADKKEYPQYTRPEDFMGLKVPKILLSGDHKKIAEWREKKSKIV